MSVLCFGSFARILKNATATTNEFLIELLFTPFYRDGINIDKADKSRLINSRMTVTIIVKDQADTSAIIDMMNQYFQDSVVIHIKQSEKHKLISLLVGIINGDSAIPEKLKADFLSKADVEHLSVFLSNVFLYAVQQPNKLKEDPIPITPIDNGVYTIIAGRIYMDGKELILPDSLTPPENIETTESIYIVELLRAYADAEHIAEFTASNLPNKYKRHFNEQRQNYYNVEAIRRSVRDTGVSEQFDYFVEDTYDAVIDVCDQSHANGYERLLKVLQQAANRPKGRSLLENLPNWIGASEKKGACHILVNEGKIKWVITNEEDI